MKLFFLLQVQPSEMSSKTRTTVTDSLSVDVEGDAAVQHQETSDHTAAATSKAWPQRFTIVGLCFFAFMLCNMDRVNMSIAVLPMQQQYAWNSQTLGIVQSSFFWCALLSLLFLCHCILELSSGRSHACIGLHSHAEQSCPPIFWHERTTPTRSPALSCSRLGAGDTC